MAPRIVVQHPRLTGKRLTILEGMRAALKAGDHAHLIGRDGVQGVHCTDVCRQHGVTPWPSSTEH